MRKTRKYETEQSLKEERSRMKLKSPLHLQSEALADYPLDHVGMTCRHLFVYFRSRRPEHAILL